MLYADDTCLFYFGNSIHDIVSKAQNDLSLINEWFQSNLLTVNASKTSYMIFRAVNKIIHEHNPLTLNGETLQRCDSEKYLGLILDEHLTWKPHINRIRSKISSLMGLLRPVVKCFPKNVRKIIYNSLVKSNLEYLIEVWGTASKSNLKELQTAQNKIIKVLFHYDFFTRTHKLYNKETKIMSVNQIYTYNTCCLIRKIIKKDIHTDITFKRKNQIHKYNTRNSKNFVLIQPRTNYGKKSITYEGAQLFNKLPSNIKEATSLFIFKKRLKDYILEKIPYNPV